MVITTTMEQTMTMVKIKKTKDSRYYHKNKAEGWKSNYQLNQIMKLKKTSRFGNVFQS